RPPPPSPLSLHDALPIWADRLDARADALGGGTGRDERGVLRYPDQHAGGPVAEHGRDGIQRRDDLDDEGGEPGEPRRRQRMSHGGGSYVRVTLTSCVFRTPQTVGGTGRTRCE